MSKSFAHRLLVFTIACILVSLSGLHVSAEDKKKTDKKATQKTTVRKSGSDLIIEPKKQAPKAEVPPADAMAEYEPYVPQDTDATVPRSRSDVRKSKKGVFVINNDDLERMFGKSRPAPAASSPGGYAGGVTSAAAPELEGIDTVDLEKKARIDWINGQLARLRNNLQRLRNPFLGRPDWNPQEQRDQDGLDAISRIDMTNRRIKELQTELAELRRKATSIPD